MNKRFANFSKFPLRNPSSNSALSSWKKSVVLMRSDWSRWCLDCHWFFRYTISFCRLPQLIHRGLNRDFDNHRRLPQAAHWIAQYWNVSCSGMSRTSLRGGLDRCLRGEAKLVFLPRSRWSRDRPWPEADFKGCGCSSRGTRCSIYRSGWFHCTSYFWIAKHKSRPYIDLFVALHEIVEISSVFLVIVSDKFVKLGQLGTGQLTQPISVESQVLKRTLAQTETKV